MLILPLQDPGVTPNSNGLPGLSAIRQMVGALQTMSLVVCVGVVIVGAAAWALGSLNSSPHYAGKGKIACVLAAIAAILIASANKIVAFFSNIPIG
ncbi:DUF6112 family protein [Kribbella sp. NPDC051620]|uniref:DUF6112 family protein n=1 Tax=Kribbella sp. NPDC051620 TaxID=3364120 RepID=UPI00379D8E07